MERYYLAVDIGASSGRHILAHMEDGKMVLEEVYRFPNGMDNRNGTLCWDVERLFAEIRNGLKKCGELGKIPSTMGIDTWAVDYVLPATHDTGSAVLAVPTNDDDALYISSGTWSLMGIERKEADCSMEAMRANFTNEGGYDHRQEIRHHLCGGRRLQRRLSEPPDSPVHREERFSRPL